MTLSKHVAMLSEDAPAMHKVCCRIAARRAAERKVLPAPEDQPQLSGLKRSNETFDRILNVAATIILIICVITYFLTRP
ncbi:MAG: hypothetical protein V4662_25090 [Verrucomicrobiota bacterium]